VKVFATKEGSLACWAYSATLGGGLVGGDEIQLTADVTEESRALLTTQASTKVYRSLRPARQTVCAMVAGGALLAVVPDPIVCFAAADFTQVQRYDLRGDASLVVVDWITSGRHAAGERWAFSRYESRLAISRDNRSILHDALVLERSSDSVAERMGRFEVLLTAVLTGPLVSQAAEAVLNRLTDAPIITRAELVLSASKLRDGGALLRIAGVSVEEVGRTLRDVLKFLSVLIGDDPWSRKW
jgi:urease accessory protein